MAKIEILKPFILSYEGGYVNDPADKGGATCKGVTLATFKAWRKKMGLSTPTATDLKNISDAEWDNVFKTLFWDKWQADSIEDQSIANLLVDWLWLSGSYGIRIPQSVIGAEVDGIVGRETLSRINSLDASTLFVRLKQERKDFIERICKSDPTNKKFKKGWLRRLDAIRYGSLTLNGGKKVGF